MNNIELAQKVGLVKRLTVTDDYALLLNNYAAAVIEAYKARLVPVGYFQPNPYHGYQQVAKEFEGIDDHQVRLYALKETE